MNYIYLKMICGIPNFLDSVKYWMNYGSRLFRSRKIIYESRKILFALRKRLFASRKSLFAITLNTSQHVNDYLFHVKECLYHVKDCLNHLKRHIETVYIEWKMHYDHLHHQGCLYWDWDHKRSDNTVRTMKAHEEHVSTE